MNVNIYQNIKYKIKKINQLIKTNVIVFNYISLNIRYMNNAIV